MSYREIKNLGPNTRNPMNNPLTYCIGDNFDIKFNHGPGSEDYGQYSEQCQLFLSQYCADNWDGYCDLAATNDNNSFPNFLDNTDALRGLTAGDILVKNTAERKYSRYLGQCNFYCQPFDYLNPNSDYVCRQNSVYCGVNGQFSGCSDNVSGVCEKYYDIDLQKENIDKDPVLNRLMDKPYLAPHILKALCKILLVTKRFETISGSRFYNFCKAYFLK